MDCSMSDPSVLHCLPEFTQIHAHWVDDAIQPTHSLLPPLLLPSIFPSIRVFSNESALPIKWPKYWSISFSQQSFQWIFRLISFRIDCFDLLTVQGTLKTLLQHHTPKASVLWCSAFFMVQLSHPGFPHNSAGKESACNVGDLGSIPGLGRSPGEGKG